MNISKILILFFTAYTCYPTYSQKNYQYTQNEKDCITLFNSFTKYLKTSINNKSDITDTSHLKHILINYLFVDRKLDTTGADRLVQNGLTNEQLSNLKLELFTFYKFLQERENRALAENLIAIPLRLTKDIFIYNKMTSFQKQNTFAFYDKRQPKHTLGYLLFIPPVNDVISEPRIWSWTLLYKFGKVIFKSITGEEGHEYLFKR